MNFKFLVALGIIVVLFWLFWLRVFPGFYVADNNADYFLGSYYHSYQSLKTDKKFALLNYHQYLGDIHHGQGQSGVLYPLIYLSFSIADLLSLGLGGGIEILILIHLLIASTGLYALLRQYDTNKLIALIASLVYISNPFIFGVSRYWVVVIYLAAWQPWIYFFLSRWLKRNSKVNFSGLVLIKTFLVLQGYIQWFVLHQTFEFLFIFLKRKHLKKTRFFLYSLHLFIIGLLTAPVLLSLKHAADMSVRRSYPLSIETRLELSVSFVDWFQAQLFRFKDDVIFHGSTYIYFCGVVLIALLLAGVYQVVKRKELRNYPFTLLAITAFVSSTTISTLVLWLPILNLFRWPFKHLIIANFFLIISVCVLWVKRKNMLTIGLITTFLFNIVVNFQHATPEFAFSSRLVTSNSTTDWEKTIDTSKGRIFTFNSSENNSGDLFLSTGGYTVASLVGAYDFGGYNALESIKTWEITQGLPAFGALSTDYTPDMVEYLRSWAIRYWVTPDHQVTQILIDSYDMKLAYEDDQVTILEDSKAYPLVFYESDKSEVPHEFFTNSIKAYPEKDDHIVFNVVNWEENYQGFESGEEVVITDWQDRPSTAVQASKTYEITYIDHSFNRGIQLSLFGLLALVGYMFKDSLFKNFFGNKLLNFNE